MKPSLKVAVTLAEVQCFAKATTDYTLGNVFKSLSPLKNWTGLSKPQELGFWLWTHNAIISNHYREELFCLTFTSINNVTKFMLIAIMEKHL